MFFPAKLLATVPTIVVAASLLVVANGSTGSPEAAAVSTSTRAFLARAIPAAQATQRTSGVPASVTVAQAILESGWGRSELTRRANNYFGIKCSRTPSPHQSGCAVFSTYEYVNGRYVRTTAAFRTYRTMTASFADHARLLSRSYPAAMAVRHDADAFIRRVHAGGYATDPLYAGSVTTVMRAYGLYRHNVSGLRISTAGALGPATPGPAAPVTGGVAGIPAAARGWVVDRSAPADRVRVLQQALQRRGHRVSVTGRWDRATAAAVRAHQAKHGIRPDGVVGPRTWRTL